MHSAHLECFTEWLKKEKKKHVASWHSPKTTTTQLLCMHRAGYIRAGHDVLTILSCAPKILPIWKITAWVSTIFLHFEKWDSDITYGCSLSTGSILLQILITPDQLQQIRSKYWSFTVSLPFYLLPWSRLQCHWGQQRVSEANILGNFKETNSIYGIFFDKILTGMSHCVIFEVPCYFFLDL